MVRVGLHKALPLLQVREIRLDYREATGPCKARALAQKLWAGEEYYLQLDAHMRFAPGWDEALIQWLHQAEAEHPGSQPVISTYPPGYEVCPQGSAVSWQEWLRSGKSGGGRGRSGPVWVLK